MEFLKYNKVPTDISEKLKAEYLENQKGKTPLSA
jgi:hypothetical protein